MDNGIHFTIIRSRRKTISIEITALGEVFVRAPRWVSKSEIDRFVAEKGNWIQKHLVKIQCRQEQLTDVKMLTDEEIEQLANQALEVIPKRVEHYARLLNVTYGRITVRNQKTLWGSCSNKGNLNFNCLLMLAPPEVLDYVVVHELCHRKEMNHSKHFWSEVAQIIPDYKVYRKWLKEQGHTLLYRSHG